MSDENTEKNEILDLLFESSEENLYSLNEKYKEEIKNLTKITIVMKNYLEY